MNLKEGRKVNFEQPQLAEATAKRVKFKVNFSAVFP